MPCWSARVGGPKMRQEGIYISIFLHIYCTFCPGEGPGRLACRPAISGSCLLLCVSAIRGRLPAFVPSSGATHSCGVPACDPRAHACACCDCFPYALVSEVGSVLSRYGGGGVGVGGAGGSPESPSPVPRCCYPACLLSLAVSPVQGVCPGLDPVIESTLSR